MDKQLNMFGEREPEKKKSEKQTPTAETNPANVTAKCPVCGFTCQESKLKPNSLTFYCGYCSDVKGEKVYFTIEVPF